jgi:hypothetical protein
MADIFTRVLNSLHYRDKFMRCEIGVMKVEEGRGERRNGGG